MQFESASPIEHDSDLIEANRRGPWEARSGRVKAVVYLLAVTLGILGLLFVFAAGQGNAVIRLVIGVVCLGAAATLVALVRLRPSQETHVHHSTLDISGDVALQEIICKQCGATLSEKSISVKAGAVFVQCEFCSAEFQLEEAPKW